MLMRSYCPHCGSVMVSGKCKRCHKKVRPWHLALVAVVLVMLTALWGKAHAQGTTPVLLPSGCGTANITGAGYLTVNAAGQLCGLSATTLTGSTSNASSGVATSATNLPVVSYNYVFNGTTWDQLKGDTTNGAWVNVKTSVLPAGAATPPTLAAILTQLGFGQAVMALSLPVTIASNQSTIPVTGTFFQATQPISIASAQVASGAFASGSISSGAMVDLVALSAPVAPATAIATKSLLVGCQATSAGINPTTGQQAAIDCDLNNNILVSSGGAPNIATAQVSITTGNISVASARALRRAITITNVTGTGSAYCGNTGVSTSTGTYLAGTAGSSITINTTAAVFCTVAATTQTVTVLETY